MGSSHGDFMTSPRTPHLLDFKGTDDDKRIKQVIVMRLLCRRLQEAGSVSLDRLTDAQRAWLSGAFAKVCCRVDSEEELMQIHDKAVEAGLEVHLITDSGRTEFHGQPTRTCLAIGPDEADKIDAITGHLPLL